MASLEECRAALERLAGQLEQSGPPGGDRSMDRTVSATLPDLGVTFTGRLHDGRIDGLSTQPPAGQGRAQIRLTLSSDDLLALTDGRLDLGRAWASRRVKIEASVLDLVRLRSLL